MTMRSISLQITHLTTPGCRASHGRHSQSQTGLRLRMYTYSYTEYQLARSRILHRFFLMVQPRMSYSSRFLSFNFTSSLAVLLQYSSQNGEWKIIRGRGGGRRGVTFFGGAGLTGSSESGDAGPPVGPAGEDRAPEVLRFTAAIGKIAAALAKVRCMAASASRMRATHLWKPPTVAPDLKYAAARFARASVLVASRDANLPQARDSPRLSACLIARSASPFLRRLFRQRASAIIKAKLSLFTASDRSSLLRFCNQRDRARADVRWI